MTTVSILRSFQRHGDPSLSTIRGAGYGDASTNDHIVHGGHARSESGGNGARLANIMISKRPEGARFALIRAESPLPKGHPEIRQQAQ